MKISIVIPTFNNADDIATALDSIKKQGFKETEIIVVDDCSSDSNLNLLSSLQEKYNFRLLKNKVNLGPSATRNKGIVASSGDLIAFLDADDYWLEERLIKTIEPFKRSDDLDVVFSDAYLESAGESTKIKQSEIMPPPKNKNVISHLFRRNSINMCAVTMKTSLAKKIMFDESLRSAEDYDFWLRVASTGAKFHYINKPLVVYRIHSSNLSGKRILSIDSTLKVLKKNSRLATDPLAKNNLTLHKINLIEERLLVEDEPSELLKTLEQLASLRKLGKREHITYGLLRFNKPLGKICKDKLLK